MAKHLNFFGLSGRVVLFFGRNPEEELTTLDIAEKFDVRAEDVRHMLRRAVEDSLLAKPTRGGGPDSYATYAAGPVLLSLIGLAMQACAPTGNVQIPAGRR